MAAARSTSSVGFAPIAEEGGAGDDAEARARISVILRVRPMSAAELSSESVPIIGVHGNRMSIVDPVTVQVTDRSVHSLASLPKRVFTYDHVMSTQTQAEVYAVAGAPLIEHAFSGYNCSVFAYGQTGSGKSYTMMGTSGILDPDHADLGLIPRLCYDLFQRLASPARTPDASLLEAALRLRPGTHVKVQYGIVASYYEIYCERVRDLFALSMLGPDVGSPSAAGRRGARRVFEHTLSTVSNTAGAHPGALKVREHPTKGAYVEGLTQVPITCYGDIEKLLVAGSYVRTVAETRMNELSSRSHAIFTLEFSQIATDANSGEELLARRSKMVLVDLAGSERSDTLSLQSQLQQQEVAAALQEARSPGGSNPSNVMNATVTPRASLSGLVQRQREMTKINSSLSCLGAVIAALSKRGDSADKTFVPYRNSILTWLLKDSLGGNARTTVIATVSPADVNYNETLSTLKYCESVKRIVLTAHANDVTLLSTGAGISFAPSPSPLPQTSAEDAELILALRQQIVSLEEEVERLQSVVDASAAAATEAGSPVAPFVDASSDGVGQGASRHGATAADAIFKVAAADMRRHGVLVHLSPLAVVPSVPHALDAHGLHRAVAVEAGMPFLLTDEEGRDVRIALHGADSAGGASHDAVSKMELMVAQRDKLLRHLVTAGAQPAHAAEADADAASLRAPGPFALIALCQDELMHGRVAFTLQPGVTLIVFVSEEAYSADAQWMPSDDSIALLALPSLLPAAAAAAALHVLALPLPASLLHTLGAAWPSVSLEVHAAVDSAGSPAPPSPGSVHDDNASSHSGSPSVRASRRAPRESGAAPQAVSLQAVAAALVQVERDCTTARVHASVWALAAEQSDPTSSFFPCVALDGRRVDTAVDDTVSRSTELDTARSHVLQLAASPAHILLYELAPTPPHLTSARASPSGVVVAPTCVASVDWGDALRMLLTHSGAMLSDAESHVLQLLSSPPARRAASTAVAIDDLLERAARSSNGKDGSANLVAHLRDCPAGELLLRVCSELEALHAAAAGMRSDAQQSSRGWLSAQAEVDTLKQALRNAEEDLRRKTALLDAHDAALLRLRSGTVAAGSLVAGSSNSGSVVVSPTGVVNMRRDVPVPVPVPAPASAPASTFTSALIHDSAESQATHHDARAPVVPAASQTPGRGGSTGVPVDGGSVFNVVAEEVHGARLDASHEVGLIISEWETMERMLDERAAEVEEARRAVAAQTAEVEALHRALAAKTLKLEEARAVAARTAAQVLALEQALQSAQLAAEARSAAAAAVGAERAQSVMRELELVRSTAAKTEAELRAALSTRDAALQEALLAVTHGEAETRSVREQAITTQAAVAAREAALTASLTAARRELDDVNAFAAKLTEQLRTAQDLSAAATTATAATSAALTAQVDALQAELAMTKQALARETEAATSARAALEASQREQRAAAETSTAALAALRVELETQTQAAARAGDESAAAAAAQVVDMLARLNAAHAAASKSGTALADAERRIDTLCVERDTALASREAAAAEVTSLSARLSALQVEVADLRATHASTASDVSFVEAECERLRDVNKKLAGEREALAEQLGDVSTQRHALADTNSSLRARVDELTAALHVAATDGASAVALVAELRRQLLSVQEECTSASARAAASEVALTEVRGAADAAATQCAALERRAAELSAEVDALRSTHASEAEAVTALHAERAALTDKLLKTQAEVAALSQQLASAKLGMDDAVAQAADASRQLASAHSERATLLLQVSTTASQRDAAATQARTTAASLLEAVEAERRSAAEVASLTQRVSALTADLREAGERLADARREQAAAAANAAEARDNVARLQSDVSALSEQLSVSTREAATASARLVEVTTEVKRVATERDEVTLTFARYREETSALVGRSAAQQAELKQLNNRLTELQHELTVLTRERATLSDSVRALSSERSAWEERHASVSAELAQARTLSATSAADLAEAHEQVKKLLAEVGMLTSRMETASGSLAELEHQLDASTEELSLVVAERNDAQERAQALGADASRLQATVRTLSSEVEARKSELAQHLVLTEGLQRDVSSSREALHATKAELRSAKASIQTLTQQCQDAAAAHESARDEVAALRTRLQASESALAAATAAAQASSNEVAELRAALEARTLELHATQEELHDAVARVLEAEEAEEAANQAAEAAAQQLRDERDTVSRLQTQAGELIVRVAAAQRAYDDIKVQYDAAASSTDSLHTKNARLAQEESELRSSVHSLQATFTSMSEKLLVSLNDAFACRLDREQAASHREILLKQLAGAVNADERVVLILHAIQMELASLKSEAGGAGTELHRLRDECARVSAERTAFATNFEKASHERQVLDTLCQSFMHEQSRLELAIKDVLYAAGLAAAAAQLQSAVSGHKPSASVGAAAITFDAFLVALAAIREHVAQPQQLRRTMSRVSSSASMMMSPRMGVGLASLGSFRADATTRRSMSFMASPSGTIDPVESPGGGSQLSPATGGAPGGTSHLSSPGALRRLSSLSAPAMQQATTAGTLTPPRELLGGSDGSDSGQRSRASSGSKSDVGMDASSLLLRHAASASSSASVRGAATRSALMSPPPMIAEQYATDEEHTAYSHRSGASVDSELSDVSNFNAATFASPADADVRGQ